MKLDLADLRVIVTGGGAGIGLATARQFAEAGAGVAICDIDHKALANAPTDLAFASFGDVGSTESMDRFMEAAIAALGGIDVVVNNAGITGPAGQVHDLQPAEVVTVLDVNVGSVVRTARHVVPFMIEQGSGCILNVASSAGYLGFPYRSPYAASKWAMIGMTKTMAMELGEHGIRVNAICPGSITGPRMDRVIGMEAEASGRSSDDVRRGFARQVSMRTFIDAEEVAQTLAFLACPLGAKISGQVLSVDGHTETLRTT